MTTYVRRCMIIAASSQSLAQSIATQLADPPIAGEGMWTTACSPTGVLPATHYITEGPIDKQFADLLADANSLYYVVNSLGFKFNGVPITLAQINTLLSTGDVSEDGPFTALARLGLQIIQPLQSI